MISDQPIPTMVRSIAEAKAHFSAIVDEASGGKAFIICCAGRPLVMITPYVQSDPVRRPGALKGKSISWTISTPCRMALRRLSDEISSRFRLYTTIRSTVSWYASR